MTTKKDRIKKIMMGIAVTGLIIRPAYGHIKEVRLTDKAKQYAKEMFKTDRKLYEKFVDQIHGYMSPFGPMSRGYVETAMFQW